MTDSLVDRLAEKYVVEEELAELYVDHARSLTEAYYPGSIYVDEPVHEATVVHGLAEVGIEAVVQSLKHKLDGTYVGVPITMLRTNPQPQHDSEAYSSAVEENTLVVDYDFNRFSSFDSGDHSASVDDLAREEWMDEALSNEFDFLGRALFAEGVTEHTAKRHLGLVDSVRTAMKRVFDALLYTPVNRSVEKMQNLSLREFPPAKKTPFRNYLDGFLRGFDAMMEDEAMQERGSLREQSYEKSGVWYKRRSLRKETERPASKSFMDLFLSSENVYKSIKDSSSRTERYQRGRDRIVVNELYKYGSRSEALKQAKRRKKRYQNTPDLKPFEEREAYYGFLEETLKVAGETTPELIPFKP